MSIRARLRIGLILVVAALATTGGLLMEVSERLSTAREHSEFAQRLVAGAFRLSMVTNDYLSHPGERARAQWTIEHERMRGLANTAGGSASTRGELLDRIADSLESARSLFAEITEAREKGRRGDAEQRALGERIERRLAGQVMVKLEAVVDSSRMLADEARDESAVVQARTSRVVTGLVILVGLLAVGDAVIVLRLIAGPIRRLREGANVIAGGDLDHRVEVRSRDEVGELAAAFNDMAGRLKATLGSLEERIEEQRRAEEEVRRRNATLSGINEVFEESFTCESGEEVARRCLGVAERLTGSAFGFVGEVNEEGRFDTLALSDPGWDECRMPKPNAVKLIHGMEIRGIWGEVLKSNASLIANDPSGHPVGVGVPAGHPTLTAFLGVPLVYGGKTIGMIALGNAEGGYDSADQETIEALSVSFVEALMAKRAELELREHREHLEELVRKRTAQLEESEARFRELYDQAPVGYHELDSEGRITRVNQTELEMLGYKAQDMLGRPVWEFAIETETARRATEGKLAGTTELGRAFERTYGRKDGSTFPVLIEDRHLRDAKGDIVGMRSTIQDVTRLKEAEEKLKETMKRLEESNRELEQFAYVASHDLQEPLRMVASYTQLLARRYKDKLDSDANEFIGYAVDGAVRMQRLINDLLAYSRVTTRGKPFESVDSKAVLEEALANLKVVIEETGAEVTHGELPEVRGDRTQLARVFQNFVSNAIKFRREDAPRVHVSAERQGKEWVFGVRDNGIGIDPKYSDRIFVIFQRLHGREEYAGTGIGLAVCARIVDRHGGRIWVESTAGTGSTFYFTLRA